MKLLIDKGRTSLLVELFILNVSSQTGAGLTGLLFNTSSLTCYRARQDDGNAGGTAITLVTATRGTWTSGGFIEKDATNLPGVYEFGVPDAALATGSETCIIMLKGAANMAPVVLELQLLAPDPQSIQRLAKNTALNNFMFFMADSVDHITPKTGLTVTCQRSIDGAAFANCATATATEVSAGWYKVNLAATDLNGDTIALKFTATGADQTNVLVVTQVS